MGTASTQDLEISMSQNLIKIFSWSRIPTKICLMVLKRFYVPRFGDLECDHARQENVEYTNSLLCLLLPAAAGERGVRTQVGFT